VLDHNFQVIEATKVVHPPKSWRAERVPSGYAVRDASGRTVAHIYGQEEAGVTCYPTMEEAKEIALNIAKAGGAGLIGVGQG
jgi:hypothetical protein